MPVLDHFRRRTRLLAAYRTCFETESGKIVLTDLVARYHVLTPRYVDPSDGMAQALAMAQAQGQKNVVLGIVRELEITLEQLLQQQQDEEKYARSSDES